MYRVAWQATVHGVAKSQTWLSDHAQHSPMVHLGSQAGLNTGYRYGHSLDLQALDDQGLCMPAIRTH